ncbi:MAG: hypothetical protein R2849_00085 [Thermomicrobiales bacterium]
MIALLVVPLVTAVVCRLLYRRQHVIEWANAIGSALTFLVAGIAVVDVARSGAQRDPTGLLYVDAPSAVMLGTITVVGLAASLVSIGYLRRDLGAGHVLMDAGGWAGTTSASTSSSGRCWQRSRSTTWPALG